MKELEQFDFDIEKMLEPLEVEIQQGVNLKEEDFNKNMVIWLKWMPEWSRQGAEKIWLKIRNFHICVRIFR